MPRDDEYVPSKRELHKMIRNQGVLLIVLTLTVFAVAAALTRKGVLSWGDLANLDAA